MSEQFELAVSYAVEAAAPARDESLIRRSNYVTEMLGCSALYGGEPSYTIMTQEQIAAGRAARLGLRADISAPTE